VTRRQEFEENKDTGGEKADFVAGFEEHMNHSNFYSAYSVMRILFKKRSNSFVGRFHETYPITVNNPVTN
jgi:hypothetical protein